MSHGLITDISGSIAVIRLNRPEIYNVLDRDTLEKLGKSLCEIAVNDAVRCVIITGEGKAFCAGGDLKWALSFPGGTAAALHILAGLLNFAVVEIKRMHKPVIAAINGVAAGAGFSLALSCDFRLMSLTATLKQAYSSIGLSIDGGGTFMLPRLVGLARALEIASFDETLDAARAFEIGLTNRIAEKDLLMENSLKMASELCETSLNSFGIAKKLMTDSFETSFETQIENERRYISYCANHTDGKEGIAAFNSKRKPQFQLINTEKNGGCSV